MRAFQTFDPTKHHPFFHFLDFLDLDFLADFLEERDLDFDLAARRVFLGEAEEPRRRRLDDFLVDFLEDLLREAERPRREEPLRELRREERLRERDDPLFLGWCTRTRWRRWRRWLVDEELELKKK